MEKTIKNLIRIGKNYFGESFSFSSKTNTYYAISNNMSQAENIRKNEKMPVKVINWFDDIWIYISIKFVPNFIRKAFPYTYFSLSVFQGNAGDNKKTQLFRAEWDNYPDNENLHSQPHWHIYPHKYKMKVHQDFEEFIELSENDGDFHTFKNSDKNLIEINRFHFAMNAQWSEKKTDIHTIRQMDDLTNWFDGLLHHLITELKDLKEL